MSSAEIFPSESLDKTLVLGNLLYGTVTKLRELRQRMEIAYSQEHYLDTPLLMSLPKLGVRLMFGAAGTQPLLLIEVLSFDFMKLLYKGHYLNDIVYHTPSDEELVLGTADDTLVHLQQNKHVLPPTLKEVYNKIFGPTFPGELHMPSHSYLLSYPGIAFRFEIRLEDLCRRIADLEDKNRVLSHLTNWETATDIPCVSLAIFEGEDYPSFIGKLQHGPRSEPVARPSHFSELAVEKLHVTLSTGTAELRLLAKHQRSSATLTIGESTQQDVIRLLGPADSYFNKFDSRLLIHKHLRPGPTESPDACSVAKFHNYFRHGIDFLYNLNPACGNGGVLEKIVIHNGGNIKSLDFMHWNRCNWSISTSAERGAAQVDSETYFDDFDPEFFEQIGGDSSQPVLLNRGDSETADDYDLELVLSEELKNGSCTNQDDATVSKQAKTWGQLRLHGYQRCILEVNESNNCVSCVTIY
ncbi:hypothetical protein METBIDRAFT_77356 [Metschnikowia bicuspidata var. bicuspidata NRRL YB-4993]|uniref:Uncharacterized protein n=1 Tax=Metschnikowia bicuspidata var. bicuspidata NRRL YB-4993 TaxID=869754 RepID=A0A1A0HCX6_9ASCO|nr:hypothetical protein METBIDRAFT_77356 [Metschnikowia bicuspidata var. bicuspidata NRRL YB-4993]OBA21783.1 hypothetical protein METBIDRAFT_77356 [Metschnikowia bicuspidata var. bicuspidata NRRL YB-4993]